MRLRGKEGLIMLDVLIAAVILTLALTAMIGTIVSASQIQKVAMTIS